jgi:hypothetical protein
LRALLRLGEIADLAPERIHFPTQAIELVVRPLTARAARRWRHRLQLQPQPPIRLRPSERQRGDGADTEHDRGEGPEPSDDPAPPLAQDRPGILCELFVERIEPRHLCPVQSIGHRQFRSRLPFPSPDPPMMRSHAGHLKPLRRMGPARKAQAFRLNS